MTATLNTIASSSPSLIIASRESRLALWQAEHIRNRLSQLHPSRSISILGMSTRGDRILDRPLAAIGGKGLFIKELEVAMQNGQAHLAVHSMKDVPMQMPEGFLLAAITEREDPRDALISNRYESLGALPPGAIVGTASLRREACLRARFPGLDIRPLRGNLDTRLRKLDAGEFDAIILAGAGLIRLGLKERIRAFLPLEESIPAPGQGALGIEIYNEAANAEAIRAAVEPLGHRPTMLCVCAERAFSLALGGSCQLPLGAYADIHGDTIRLNGFVALRDGSRVLEDRLERQVDNETEAALLGRTLAAELLRRGAGEILAAQV